MFFGRTPPQSGPPSERFGEGVPWFAASRLILEDVRLNPETRLLYLLVADDMLSRRLTQGKLDLGWLAYRMGRDKRTVHRLLATITAGHLHCITPLLQVEGPENERRVWKLRYLGGVYGGQPGDYPISIGDKVSFESLHGPWVSAHGFVAVARRVLGEPSVSPAARLAYLLVLGRYDLKGGNWENPWAELGNLLGLKKRDNVRLLVAQWDVGLNPDSPVAWAYSQTTGARSRLWELHQVSAWLENMERQKQGGHPPENVIPQDLCLDNIGLVTDLKVSEQKTGQAALRHQQGDDRPESVAAATTKIGGHRPENGAPFNEKRKEEEHTPTSSALGEGWETHWKQVLEVCGAWRELGQALAPDALHGIAKGCGETEKLCRNLDVLGHLMETRQIEVRSVVGLLHKSLKNGGLQPGKGYRPWEERRARALSRDLPMVDPRQMDLFAELGDPNLGAALLEVLGDKAFDYDWEKKGETLAISPTDRLGKEHGPALLRQYYGAPLTKVAEEMGLRIEWEKPLSWEILDPVKGQARYLRGSNKASGSASKQQA